MPTPVLTKSYEFDVNNVVYDVDNTELNKQLLLGIVNAMTNVGRTTPWVVVQSSNGTVADSNNNWSTTADINWDLAGNAHSWIVLRQSALSATYEVCIDLNTNNVNDFLSFTHTTNGFLSNGTTTDRPTASEEVEFRTQGHWGLATSTAFAVSWNLIMSTDGEVTHVLITRSNATQAEWHFEKVANTPVGWDYPIVASVDAIVGSNSPTVARWATGHTSMYYGLSGNSNEPGLDLALTSPLGLTDPIGKLIENSFDYSIPAYRIGLVTELGVDFNWHGLHGMLYDTWWAPIVRNRATFPEGTPNFAQFGERIFPWDGSSRIKVP